MEIFKTKTTLNKFLEGLKKNGSSLGLVPTMGALHEGHLSLVSTAISQNDWVVVSIFVNPTQFNNLSDLENYPKTFEDDLAMLQQTSERIVVFAPSVEEVYEGNLTTGDFTFDGLDKVMEGEFRANHFNGVATIVKILFQTIRANRAYFGEKDFQQLQIIKKLVEKEEIPIEIVPCPIEREENGLARSSRNERLTKLVRKQGGFIYDVLKNVKSKFGTENAIQIKEWVIDQFASNEIFNLEYFEITDIDTLTPILKKQKDRKYRAFIAVYADDVRLIDNIALN
ncbi:pantoate--beta-alanine ligase [Muricauda sp. DJ-13]|uniref:Pantothenate synthetase n=2 Tax=Croceivirga thetidis TaxID=2721623 RepID=A0ABX1GNJ7_9FLAO|nr:pantoate--beta-alanine ligase [Croceivirga thetidis]